MSIVLLALLCVQVAPAAAAAAVANGCVGGTRAMSYAEMLAFDAEHDEPFGGNGLKASRQLYHNLLPRCLGDDGAGHVCARAQASSQARHDAKLAVRARGDILVRLASPIFDAARHFPKWRPTGLQDDELWALKARAVKVPCLDGVVPKECPAVCRSVLSSSMRTNERVNSAALSSGMEWSVGAPRQVRTHSEKQRDIIQHSLVHAALLFTAYAIATGTQLYALLRIG